MLSLDNICPYKQVAKGFLQTCPKIQPSLLGSTIAILENTHRISCFSMNTNLYLYL